MKVAVRSIKTFEWEPKLETPTVRIELSDGRAYDLTEYGPGLQVRLPEGDIAVRPIAANVIEIRIVKE